MRLVIDWDGTVTVSDTMDLFVRVFGDAVLVYRFSDAFIDDSKPLPVTLQHVVESEMATIKTPLDEVVDWLLENVELRPGFIELAKRERPLLLSSNLRQLIEPLLDHFGIEADLLANEMESPAGASTSTERSARSAASAASARSCRRARWSMSVTATPIAARRSPPHVSSPAVAWRAISTRSALHTSPSVIFIKSPRRSNARPERAAQPRPPGG
jgi:hypothetical protein